MVDWVGERAQSTQIGFILLFAAIIIAFAGYQAVVVPNQNTAVEVNQNVETQAQFEQLRNVIVGAPGTANSREVRLTLGVRYPSRLATLNPGPASGALRTVNTTDPNASATISNARAGGEVGDFWNGTTHRYNTGRLVYEPQYNLYQGAPTTVYENSLVYNRFRDGTEPVTGQTLVQGRTINLVTLNGSLSTTRTDSVTVDPRYLSASRNSVQLSGTNPDQGLFYEYYEADYGPESSMPDFEASNLVTTGGVDNFDISERQRENGFAFRFVGDLRVDDGGTYTFYTASDDGSRLYVDGERVVDNDGQHSVQAASGETDLDPGEHNVTVTYFEDDGANVLDVEWQGPDTGGSREPIPDDRLSNDQGVGGDPVTVSVPTRLDNETWGELLAPQLVSNGGYVADYDVDAAVPYEYYEAEYDGVSTMPEFDEENLVTTGETDGFDMKALKERADDFAFRFNKRLRVPESGEYTFYTTSDDGSRLYVDGERLVNNDGQHANRTRSSDPVFLDRGFHDITVTFFENDVNDGLVVEWEGPTVSRQEIPASALADRTTRELTLEMARGSQYRLRTARVGVGTGLASQQPAYLVPVTGQNASVPENGTQAVAFEVRDAHNNPVPNAVVNVTVERGDLVDRPSTTTATTDGEGRLALTYRAPEDIDGLPKDDAVDASISRAADSTDFDASTPDNATVPLLVRNTDGSGLGTDSTTPYEIQWEDPSGQSGTTALCDSERCTFDANQALTATLTVNTTDTAVGVDVDYSVNDTSVGTVTSTGETDTEGEDTTTFEAEGTGPVGVNAVSAGSVDTIEMVVSGDRLLDEDFESGSLNGSSFSAVQASDSGVDSEASESGSFSAYHGGGPGNLTSDALDTSGYGTLDLSYWIQNGTSGDNGNPAGPQADEDLVVEYRDSGGTWVEIERFPKGDGQSIDEIREVGIRSVQLNETETPAAFHSNFRLRFRQTDGGDGLDYWRVDDVRVSAIP